MMNDIKPEIKVSKNGMFWHWQIVFNHFGSITKFKHNYVIPVCEGLVKDESEAWRIARDAYKKHGFGE